MTRLERIRARQAGIGVVGLGYVGLPLAVGFASRGFRVVGVDLDEGKVRAINAGGSHIADVPAEFVARLVAAGALMATTDFSELAALDAVLICVPTPISANKSPDLRHVLAAAEGVAGALQPGQIVVLQSTTHPGTTEEDVLPRLERSGLKAGVDFHLAFCPERINPGDRGYDVHNTPKVVGGLTPACTAAASALMESFGAPVHPVSSPRVAEMAKLLENIFRSVNISLVNEMAMLSERMRIDFWEVIAAASTKPFGFMPFYPGPGVGGHCIPVDPFYLSAKAREYDFSARFIELAAEINQAMPYHAVEKVGRALDRSGRTLHGASVLVLGVAFKKDVDDARNSAAERVIELLLNAGADVRYHDPHIPSFHVGGSAIRPAAARLESIPLTDAALAAADCVVVLTGHSSVDYVRVAAHARLVVDTVNAVPSAAFAVGRPDPV